MEIFVNGKPREVSEALSLLFLLKELKLNPVTTIVELNREVVLKEAYAVRVLRQGDKVELIRLVGGG